MSPATLLLAAAILAALALAALGLGALARAIERDRARCVHCGILVACVEIAAHEDACAGPKSEKKEAENGDV